MPEWHVITVSGDGCQSSAGVLEYPMIDTFNDAPDTIKRPEPSPSGPCLEVFAACLAGDGFSQISKANYMRVASYLCRWLIAHGHDLATLDEAALATVHEDLRRGPRMRGGSCRVAGFPPAAHRFLHKFHLKDK